MAAADLVRPTSVRALIFDGLGAGSGSPPPAHEALATLHDNFGDASIDAALWATANLGSGTVTETGGALELAGVASNAGTNYGVLESVDQYDLTGNAMRVQVNQWQTVALVSGDAGVVLQKDSSNRYEFFWDGTSQSVLIRKKVAGVVTTLATVSWATIGGNGSWLRFIEGAGTVSFDTSADGLTWTNRATSPTSTFDITALTVQFNSGTYASVTNIGKTVIDNVNVGTSSIGKAMLRKLHTWRRLMGMI